MDAAGGATTLAEAQASPLHDLAREPTLDERLLAAHAAPLVPLWAFGVAAAAVFAMLGHPLAATLMAVGCIGGDTALQRYCRRSGRRADPARAVRVLSWWLLARGAWTAGIPGVVAIASGRPAEIVFAVVLAGALLLLATLHVVLSSATFRMAAAGPVVSLAAAVAALPASRAHPALFGGAALIVLALVLVAVSAGRIRAQILARQAEKDRLIARLTAAHEEAVRRRKEAEEAREAARVAAQAKTSFLAVMSHEIRTPMNGVLGMAQLMQRSRLTAKQRGQVETIIRSGEMLMLLLNDLLDISKIDAGRMEIAAEPTDLRELVGELLSFWTPTAATRGLKLNLTFDESLPDHLELDAVRVRQILFNLVGNALKFTDEGSVSLRVGRAGADQLVFDVADTGVGIAPDALPRLFQAFSQADASDVRRFGGSGLGLAICKALSGLMGGDVSVESRMGEGSTFTLTLPLRPAAAPARAKPEPAPQAAPPAIEAEAPTLSILAADDNPTNLLVLEQLLGALGYTICKARDGREALDALNSRPFDLVLMDIQMPEMTGVEVLKAVRERPGPNRLTPLIAVTADAMSLGCENYLDLGFAAYVPKPLHVQDLVTAMMAAVANSGEPEAKQAVSA